MYNENPSGNSRKSSMLEKVRALLAKADSTTFPAEAETFRQRADELMAKYAIEQWQVSDAQDASEARPGPVERQVDFAWYHVSERRDELWHMMHDVARHCRVVIALRGYRGGSMPAIGLDSDLDYFDMLFTNLMLQMGRQLEPRWNPALSLEHNVVAMKNAGLKWDRITELCGMDAEWRRPNGSINGKAIGAYRRGCQELGLGQLKVSPSVYQRSYALGFVQEIEQRLRRMRGVRTEAMGESSSQALALRDILEQAQDAYAQMYPAPEAEGGSRRRGRSVPARKLYGGGIVAGQEAGAKADITTPSQRRIG